MSGALEGLRVVDFGQYVAGPLLARMLADQGAEVVRVDPPGGPRWQHPAAHLQSTPQEAMRDEWALSHGLSRPVEFPEAGPGQVVGPAPRLSRTPMRAPKPAPPLGWDGEAILRELGLGDHLAALVASGAVRLPERAAVPA